MAAVSETIVREFFELHEFLVRQHRPYIVQSRGADEDDIDFFVLNPRPRPLEAERPFVLGSADLAFIDRAIVVVKGWHTETFSHSVLTHSSDMIRLSESKVLRQAARAFGGEGGLLKILVVPALPQSAAAREQSIAVLRTRGIDAVIPFHTVLAALVNATEINRNYQKSDLLQTIRILKNYGLFKEPQLELFKPGRKRVGRSKPGPDALQT